MTFYGKRAKVLTLCINKYIYSEGEREIYLFIYSSLVTFYGKRAKVLTFEMFFFLSGLIGRTQCEDLARVRKRVLRRHLLALWRVRRAQGVENLKAMLGIDDSFIGWLLAEDAFMVEFFSRKKSRFKL